MQWLSAVKCLGSIYWFYATSYLCAVGSGVNSASQLSLENGAPVPESWEHTSLYVPAYGCALRAQKKKPSILQLCTHFQNDSLPLVGTFNSERVMLLSLLLFLQPPPSPRRIHLARCDICSMCSRFYGSCCSQGLVDPAEEEKARGGQVWVPGCLFSVSKPGSIGDAPGVARFHGRQWSRARSICFLLWWVWWSFTSCFLLSCWGLQFGSKQPSDSAFQMVRMQMPDLRYCN